MGGILSYHRVSFFVFNSKEIKVFVVVCFLAHIVMSRLWVDFIKRVIGDLMLRSYPLIVQCMEQHCIPALVMKKTSKASTQCFCPPTSHSDRIMATTFPPRFENHLQGRYARTCSGLFLTP